MTKSIAVIGSGSMIGQQFCQQAEKELNLNLIKADLHQDILVDITKSDSVNSFFKNNDFEWLILFSAFTDVNGAEEQRNDRNGSCWRINVDGVKAVADNCKEFGRKLIFISTDFVFDGSNGPYSEDDPPGPNFEKVSWYGITKLEGEKQILKTLTGFIIIRISYPYSGKDTGKDDFVLKLIKLYQKSELYPMYDDQVITPTFIPDIASAIKSLITENHRGIFHLASPTPTTQYHFALDLLSKLDGKSVALKKAKLKEALAKPGSTPRPLKGGLKIDKISQLGISCTTYQEGLKKAIITFRSQLI